MDDHPLDEKLKDDQPVIRSEELGITNSEDTECINPSGHRQEVHRNFSIWSVLAVGVVAGNCWTALAGSLTVAISNGYPASTISWGKETERLQRSTWCDIRVHVCKPDVRFHLGLDS